MSTFKLWTPGAAAPQPLYNIFNFYERFIIPIWILIMTRVCSKYITLIKSKHWGRSPGLVVMGSNPGAIYWMDISFFT